jgi:uracil phosphoribosyltransferase
MHFNLTSFNSVASQFIAELRDQHIQKDRLRFRRNLERIGEILAYEISKTLDYHVVPTETPQGVADMSLPQRRIVLATVLRAGLPFHQGMLNFFDHADNSFIGAYRREHKNGNLEIQLDYVGSADLNDAVLILADPMLATGASINLALQQLARFGTPAAIHIAAVIASNAGVEAVKKSHPKAYLWTGTVDEELTAKSYIVPGLGDAGDLAFGEKR